MDARTLPGCCQGCADINFNREFSSTRAPSLHELREEGLDTVSMPNERTCREMLIPQRMGPAGSIKSDQETIPRRVRLPATEPRQLPSRNGELMLPWFRDHHPAKDRG